jgi:hypothetical protein
MKGAAPGWQEFETHVQQLLGLDSTPASGGRFHAPGDAVDHHHPTQSRFPLFADCKFTQRLSFSLNRHFLLQQSERAVELGKRFILPLRFWHHHNAYEDYVVLRLDDFAELMDLARCA